MAGRGSKLDVLCVADMCVDLLVSGDVRPRFHQVEQLVGDYVVELGGSANIFASQFAKLGGAAGVTGYVGADSFGDLVLSRLRENGVDARFVRRRPEVKTGLGIALCEPDDRAILTYPGTIDAVSPEDLAPGLLQACRHWHIASYFLLGRLRSHWPEWLQRARDEGLTTSLDPNWDPDNRWEGVGELLPLVDVFFPNEAEARAIAGEECLEAAGDKLARLGTLVVIKRGRDGAAVFHPDGSRWTAVSEPVPVVDTVGAGDNFDAGFLHAWLAGREVPACLDLGCRCARASLRAPGGIAGQLRAAR